MNTETKILFWLADTEAMDLPYPAMKEMEDELGINAQERRVATTSLDQKRLIDHSATGSGCHLTTAGKKEVRKIRSSLRSKRKKSVE